MIHKPLYNLYIASCDKEGGIWHYRMTDGISEKVGFTPVDRPMYMISADEKIHILLRAPFDNRESGHIVYDIDSDGRLINSSPIFSTMGEVACHLCVDEDSVYAVNYISGSIYKSPDHLVRHSGQSVHPQRQTSPHTHFIGLTPDAKYLCVTDLGLDQIFIYDKELRKKSSVNLPAGHGPRHLAFHEDGKHVFCVNELQSTVSLLRYADGKLEMLDTVNALPRDFTGESTAAAIRCIGNTVYVSNRGHDSVSILDYSEEGLSLRKTISTYGRGPRDFLVEGDLLIAANEADDTVCLIETQNEKLLEKLSIKSPVCVLLV